SEGARRSRHTDGSLPPSSRGTRTRPSQLCATTSTTRGMPSRGSPATASGPVGEAAPAGAALDGDHGLAAIVVCHMPYDERSAVVPLKVAILGAGGNMGRRITRSLVADERYELRLIEPSDQGRALI